MMTQYHGFLVHQALLSVIYIYIFRERDNYTKDKIFATKVNFRNKLKASISVAISSITPVILHNVWIKIDCLDSRCHRSFTSRYFQIAATWIRHGYEWIKEHFSMGRYILYNCIKGTYSIHSIKKLTGEIVCLLSISCKCTKRIFL